MLWSWREILFKQSLKPLPLFSYSSHLPPSSKSHSQTWSYLEKKRIKCQQNTPLIFCCIIVICSLECILYKCVHAADAMNMEIVAGANWEKCPGREIFIEISQKYLLKLRRNICWNGREMFIGAKCGMWNYQRIKQMKSQRKFPFALFISGLMHLQRGRFFEDNQKKSAQCVALSNPNTAQHQHQTKRDSKKYPGNHIFIFSSW